MKTMRYKLFGSGTGLYVSELVLGAAMFGTASGYGADKDEVQKILQSYTEAGGNFIDTANQYQLGESERLIGEFIAPNRNDFVISSKYSRSSSANPSMGKLGNHRKAMVQAVEESLKRLKTDHIDIYFAHLDDFVTPVGEIVRGFEDLVQSGKIIYGGLANFPAWKVATAATIANVRGSTLLSAVQVEYNLLQRAADRELLPMAEGFGLGTMLYSPLAGGLLTGKYRKGESGRITLMGNTQQKNAERNDAVIDVLIAVAEETGTGPGQVAIAWAGTKGGFPIIGPRNHTHLEDNLLAASIELSQDQVMRLDEVSAVSLDYPHELNAAQRKVMTGDKLAQTKFPERIVV